MIASWLFVTAAVLGQTTQPAETAVQSAPRITVAQRPTTQPAAEIQAGGAAATAPAEATLPAPIEFDGLSGEPVTIQATEAGLVIQGSKQDIAYLNYLAELLQQQPEITFRIFALQNATARDLATSLQDLWTKSKTGVTGKMAPEDRLTVIPDARSNVLMVAAGEENMKAIAGIIDQLDQPSLGPGQVQFTPIQLKHIKATEAEQIVKDLLDTLQKQRKIDRDLFNIKADVRSNSLLVAAPKADLDQIRHLIELIDVPVTEESGGVAKVAIFPLLRAVAADMKASLDEMLQAGTEASKAAQE
ncbi:MAG: hypothetical protein HY718_11650, partial [Planctomycetes bacterium]|nr:hypothetical protein [Planctomycetota bacterium]